MLLYLQKKMMNRFTMSWLMFPFVDPWTLVIRITFSIHFKIWNVTKGLLSPSTNHRWWRKTFGDHPDFMAPISGWSSKVFQYHPCMVHGGWWQKAFRHHPNPEMDTETGVDHMRFFTHSHSNLWKFESRLSQSKRFVQNKKLQHQHINLLSYILLSDALFS